MVHKGNVSGVLNRNQSIMCSLMCIKFDFVKHQIMLDKTKCYGLQEDE